MVLVTKISPRWTYIRGHETVQTLTLSSNHKHTDITEIPLQRL